VSPADPFVDSTGTLARGGQYDYKTFTTATFAQGEWSAGLRHRFLPSIEDASAATNPNTTVKGTSSYHMIDLFGSYRFNKTVQLRGGIDNVFDIDPEIVGETPGVTAAAGVTNAQYYDVLGRRYFLAVQLDF
jgi:iron complex outermembrane recepter protein